MKRHHAIPYRKSAHTFTHRSNGPRHFMPKDPRRRMRPRMNFLQIRPADSTRIDPHQHFARANLRHGNLFSLDIINGTINSSLHSARQSRRHIPLRISPHDRAIRPQVFSTQTFIYN